MSVRRKVWISAALILLLSVPVFIYQYRSLLATAHDPARCASAYADFTKYAKYPHTGNYGTEVQYCQQVESEAWLCRYAAIIFGLVSLGCIYAAFGATKDRPANGGQNEG